MLESILAARSKLLSPHFRPGFLPGNEIRFQFSFTHDQPFFLEIFIDTFYFHVGSTPNPTVTLFLDCHQTCWDLLIGRMDGMRAFMEGKYRSDGNIVLTQLLLYSFRKDNAQIIPD